MVFAVHQIWAAQNHEQTADISDSTLERYPFIVYQGWLQSQIQQDFQGIDLFYPWIRNG